MSEHEIICVGCPMGCHVTLNIDNSGEITGFSGNECKRGKEYVAQEYKNPVRIFTATVLTKGSTRPLLPVRTNSTIPKVKMKECAYLVSRITVEPPLVIDEVVISNIVDTGADLVCSDELSE